MEPADNVPGNELGWSCSVAQLRGTSVSRACCESPLKLHTIVPTFDKRTNKNNNHIASNDIVVEISNWQTNFPAVCQGVANSVSYIMEEEFYCFRKFQHISLLIWSSHPSQLDARLICRHSGRGRGQRLSRTAMQAYTCQSQSAIRSTVGYCIHLHSNGSIHTNRTHTHTELAITRQTGGLSNRRVHPATRVLASRSHT